MMMRRRRGRARTIECPICTESVRENIALTMRCCNNRLCKDCMGGYCTEQINEGLFNISCPFTGCDKKLDHGIIVNSVEEKKKKLFEKMITESLSDPHVKTCPGCSKTERISETSLDQIKRAKNAWFTSKNSKACQIKCSDCNLEWCFSCHAPWHKGSTCSTYLKGDKAFSQWMYWRAGSDVNAHFCPKCKIPIQRSSGCPSMVCSYCNVSWCYDCGQSKNWDHTILGPHYSKYAFKGCLSSSYLVCNSRNITYLVRSILLLLMILGMFFLGSIVLIIGLPILPLILLAACTVLPLYGVLSREKPIGGDYPYRIFSKCIAGATKFGIFTLVVCVFILLGPVAILTGTTLIPLMIRFDKTLKANK